MTSNGSSQRLWARSHGLRAVLAVCFPIFFYAAAAIVGFFLIKIGLRGLGLGGRASMTVSVFCLLSGAAVLWGLLPRPVRFHEPGPLITPRAHPRLFRLLEDVSATMKVKMPDEVYLMPGVNAYVAQIGGLFGIGGRRVLVLGMPLLAVINISELRALVAHELGHYAGGETRLAGIIYQTRAAMARTTEKLLGGGIFFAYLPFEAMFQGYLAITGSISRQQELFADRWAVQLAGTEAQGSLLRHVELGQAAFSTYLQKEVAPLSVLRLAPANYFEGYRSYVGSPEYSQLLPVWESQSRERKRDRSDSHPPMAERILFAESLDLPPVAIDDAGARSLLNKSEDVELYFSRDLRPAGFRAVGWDRVGDAWEEMYRGLADRLQARIPELCVANVPAVLSDPELRERIAETTQPSLIGDRSPGRLPELERAVIQGLTAYLGCLLGTRGWRFRTAPGHPIRLERDGETLDLAVLLEEVASEEHGTKELVDALTRAGLDQNARWEVAEAERGEAHIRRRALVLSVKDGVAEITGLLSAVVWPRCCALCCGPPDHTFRIGFLDKHTNNGVRLDISVCEAHKVKGHRALELQMFDPETSRATLRLANLDYARLIEQVNS